MVYPYPPLAGSHWMDVYVRLQNIQIWEIHVNAGYEHTVFMQRVYDRNGIEFEGEEKEKTKKIDKQKSGRRRKRTPKWKWYEAKMKICFWMPFGILNFNTFRIRWLSVDVRKYFIVFFYCHKIYVWFGCCLLSMFDMFWMLDCKRGETRLSGRKLFVSSSDVVLLHTLFFTKYWNRIET